MFIAREVFNHNRAVFIIFDCSRYDDKNYLYNDQGTRIQILFTNRAILFTKFKEGNIALFLVMNEYRGSRIARRNSLSVQQNLIDTLGNAAMKTQ